MRLNVCVGGCIKMYKFKSHLKVFNMSLEMKKKRLCKMHLILYGPNNGIFLLARSSWPRITTNAPLSKSFHNVRPDSIKGLLLHETLV